MALGGVGWALELGGAVSDRGDQGGRVRHAACLGPEEAGGGHGGLGRGLGPSPLGAGAELLFPEVGEKAGILEAGRVGEVAL